MGVNVFVVLLIKHVPRIFIPKNLIPHACMLEKGCYSAKTKSAKIFLKVFPRKFTPTKITRYTVHTHFSGCLCSSMARRSFLRWRGWEIPSFLSISESLRDSSAEPEGNLSLTASRYCIIPVRRGSVWVYTMQSCYNTYTRTYM